MFLTKEFALALSVYWQNLKRDKLYVSSMFQDNSKYEARTRPNYSIQLLFFKLYSKSSHSLFLRGWKFALFFLHCVQLVIFM